MKKVRIACLLIAFGVVLWSIITDVSTYNVYFTSDKNIVLYCIDGIIFNAPKILLPIVIGATTFLYDFIPERIKNEENRSDRC